MDHMKELRWIGSSKQRLKEFPDEAMDEAGHQLRRVQKGLEPSDWKPMPAIGHGVIELRVHFPGEYRVIYVAKFPEAIYVLHAFGKKTQKTPQRDFDTARAAYAEVEKKRQES
jgi:phage-related protein